MTYSIEQIHEGSETQTPLEARYDWEAIMGIRSYVKTAPPGAAVFLAFFRRSDGQRGYLNPDGNAAVTGRSWMKGQSDGD